MIKLCHPVSRAPDCVIPSSAAVIPVTQMWLCVCSCNAMLLMPSRASSGTDGVSVNDMKSMVEDVGHEYGSNFSRS